MKEQIKITVTVDEDCPDEVIKALVEAAIQAVKNKQSKKDKFLKLKKSSDKAAGY